MAESCALFPTVFDKTGTEVKSPLYEDLETLLGVDFEGTIGSVEINSDEIYRRIINPSNTSYLDWLKQHGVTFTDFGNKEGTIKEPRLYDVLKYDNELYTAILNMTDKDGHPFGENGMRSFFTKKFGLDKANSLSEQLHVANAFNASEWAEEWIAVPDYDSRSGEAGIAIMRKENVTVDVSSRLAFSSFVDYFINRYYKFISSNKDAFEDYCLSFLKTGGYYTEFVNKMYALVNFFSNNNGSGIIGDNEIDFLIKLIENDGGFALRIASNPELRTQLRQCLQNKNGVTRKTSDTVKAIVNQMKMYFDEMSTPLLIEDFKSASMATSNIGYNIFMKDLRAGRFSSINSKDSKTAIDNYDKGQIKRKKDLWETLYMLNLEREQVSNMRKRKSPNEEEPSINVKGEPETISDRVRADRIFYRGSHDFAKTKMGKTPLAKIEDPVLNNGDTFNEANFRIETIIQSVDTAIKDVNHCKEILLSLYDDKNLRNLNSRCFDLNIVLDTLRAYERFMENKGSIMEYLRSNGISDVLATAFYNTRYGYFFKDIQIDNSTPDDEVASQAKQKIIESVESTLNSLFFEIKNMLDFQPHLLDTYANKSRKNVNADSITYWDVAVPMHNEMLTSVCPDGYVFDRHGNVVSLSEAQRIFNDDFLPFNRWIASLANTPEEVLKIYDQVVKRAQDKQRFEFNETKSKLAATKAKLHKRKFFRWNDEPDTFMFQRQVYYQSKDNKYYFIDEGAYLELIDKGHNPNDFDRVEAIEADTGEMHYIRDVKWDDFEIDYVKFANSIKNSEEYESFNNAIEREEFLDKKLEEWEDEHCESDRFGMKWPKIELYGTMAYKTLTQEQKEYYDTVLKIKMDLDKHMGPFNHTRIYKAIAVKQSGISRFATDKHLDMTIDDNPTEIRDFNNKIIHTIAKRFDDYVEVKPNGGKVLEFYTNAQPNRLFKKYCGCVASALMVYADTALKYKHLGGICNEMDLASEMFRTRNIIDKKGGQYVMKNLYDRNKFSEIFTSKAYDKWGSRFDKFVKAQVYGKFYDDEHPGLMKGGKIAQSYISCITLGLNVIAGINNIFTGQHAINIEAISHEFYGIRNMVRAVRFYFAHILDYLMEYGTDTPKSKLRLYMEKFNIMQDFEERLQELRFGRNNALKEIFSLSSLFVLNNIGEHYLQSVTFFALMDAEKLTRKDGKQVSYLDCFEKVWKDPKDHSQGATLEFKYYTYTDENGNKVTSNEYTQQRSESKPVKLNEKFTNTRHNVVTSLRIVSMNELEERALKEDKDKYDESLLKNDEISEYEFVHYVTRKSAKINQDLHGIYTTDDMSYIQHAVLGRLVIMYRKFLAPSMHRRFGRRQFDYDLRTETEGFFNPVVRMAKRPYLFVKDKVFHKDVTYEKIINTYDNATWKTLSRMAYDTAFLFLWAYLIEFLTAKGWDDDEDDWDKQMALLILYRQRAEIAMLNPLALPVGILTNRFINPLQDWFNILDSPVVGMSKVSDIMDFAAVLFTPSVWSMPVEDYSTKTRTDFEKFPASIQHQLKDIYEEEYEEELTAEIWNDLKEKEKKPMLSNVNSEGYFLHTFKKLLPTIKPIGSFLEPADQLNFYQSEMGDRLRDKKLKIKWKYIDAEGQEILKEYGYSSSKFNALPSPTRREIVQAVNDFLAGKEDASIPGYDDIAESEEQNSEED